MSIYTKNSIFAVGNLSALLIRQNTSIKRCCLRHLSTTATQAQDITETLVEPKEVQPSSFPVVRQPLPLITNRKLEHLSHYVKPQQAWLESLDTVDDEKLGLIDLHPDIFATNPRIDILHRNIHWQRTYKRIEYAKTKSRAEVRGGGRKPWPQKGMNRARHGSIRSPLWVGGGKAMGPRGPRSYFYMLPMSVRALGLRVALSIKYAQDDLHIVDSLEIPSDDSQYIEDLVESRYWGYSALFVDVKDVMPRNISMALRDTPQFNLMPVYGLNVYSILKHETLVLTLAAVEELEKKLLYEMHKTEWNTKFRSTRKVISNLKDPLVNNYG